MNRKGFTVICIVLLAGGAFNALRAAAEILGGTKDMPANMIAMGDGLIQLILSVLGMKALKDSDRAPLCVKLAAVNMGVAGIGCLVTCLSTSSGAESMTMGPALAVPVISLLMPVLYLMGARRMTA